MSWADYYIPDCVLRPSYLPAKGLYLAALERRNIVDQPSYPKPEYGRNQCNILAFVDWYIFSRHNGGYIYWDLSTKQRITVDDLLAVYGDDYLGSSTISANVPPHPDRIVPEFSREALLQRVTLLKMLRYRGIGHRRDDYNISPILKRSVYTPDKGPAIFYYTLDGVNVLFTQEQESLLLDYNPSSREPHVFAVIYDMDREYQFKCKED